MAAQRSPVVDGLGNLGRGCNVQTAVTKLLGILVVLCSMAAACSSSDTTTVVPEPVADPATVEDPGDTATTTTTTTAAVLETGADRRPADPEAPTSEWAAGVNAAGWDFHRHLEGKRSLQPGEHRHGLQPEPGRRIGRLRGHARPDLRIPRSRSPRCRQRRRSQAGESLDRAHHPGGGQPAVPRRRVLDTAGVPPHRRRPIRRGAAAGRHRRRRRRSRGHQPVGVRAHARAHPNDRQRQRPCRTRNWSW